MMIIHHGSTSGVRMMDSHRGTIVDASSEGTKERAPSSVPSVMVVRIVQGRHGGPVAERFLVSRCYFVVV